MTDEVMAWLGHAADELTPEQIKLVIEASRDIAARYPAPDEYPERGAALTASVRYLLGDTSPEAVRQKLIDARARERAAFVSAVQVAVMMVREARRTGASERVVNKKGKAEACGIDRMSLLRALGERC
jgi:hypothetical protein